MNLKKITPEELYNRLKKEELYVLDVRAEEKFNEYHIEGSRNLPKTVILEGEDAGASLPADREIVVACTTGNSAGKCAAILSEQSMNAIVLEGGITAWKEFIKNK